MRARANEDDLEWGADRQSAKEAMSYGEDRDQDSERDGKRKDGGKGKATQARDP